MGVRAAFRSESAGPSSADRVLVAPLGDGHLVVVADGAGQAIVGARAAEAVLDAARGLLDPAALDPAAFDPAAFDPAAFDPAAFDPAAFDPAALLAEVDRALAGSGAYTTAVVALVTAAGIRGASAGDSAAWIVGPGAVIDATRDQGRTLLGAGAVPVLFAAPFAPDQTVVIATDGLFKYARAKDIVRLARTTDLEAAAGGLVELVRLRSGALPDDVTVAILRPT